MFLYSCYSSTNPCATDSSASPARPTYAAPRLRSTTRASDSPGILFRSSLVNLGFGLAIWLSLSALRLPQALLCGILAGAMRFVPYVGVAIAALFAALLAMAVDPGWSLAVSTLGVFILLDIVVGQLVEPHLYGHATGLSPLAVVLGAILWSCLWGPAGLLLSTPLTLCLLVAGRHIKGLGVLELLLGNAMPLTLPQRFYQRALSDDPHEILADARAFLKKASLAAYCDRVIIPALHLVLLDAESGATARDQQLKIRRVIVNVAATLSSNRRMFTRHHHRGAVLEEVTAGRWLRQQREQLSGKWQGPLGVPRGSIVICIGLGSPADDLATELLVRIVTKREHRCSAFLVHRHRRRASAGCGSGRRCHCFSGERFPKLRTRPRRAGRTTASKAGAPSQSHQTLLPRRLNVVRQQLRRSRLHCELPRAGHRHLRVLAGGVQQAKTVLRIAAGKCRVSWIRALSG